LDSHICHVNDLQNSFYGVALGSTVMFLDRAATYYIRIKELWLN